MKLALALPLTLVLALLLAVPASAAPPVIDNFGPFEVDYVSLDHTVCPDLVIRDDEVYSFQQRTYYDNQGNLLRIEAHFWGTDHFYNPENPDVVLVGQFVGNGELDPNTGAIMSMAGVPYHITVPGYGTVLVRAGRWVGPYPDGQVAGKNSEVDPKDLEQFCSILRGN